MERGCVAYAFAPGSLNGPTPELILRSVQPFQAMNGIGEVAPPLSLSFLPRTPGGRATGDDGMLERHTVSVRHTNSQGYLDSHRRRPSCSEDTLARDFPAVFAAPCSACSPRASRGLSVRPLGGSGWQSLHAAAGRRDVRFVRRGAAPTSSLYASCCRCVVSLSLTHIVYRHTHSMPDVDGCTWAAHRQPLAALKLETPVGRPALLYHGERDASAAAARATTLGSTKLRQRSTSPGAAPSPLKRSSSHAIR